MPLSTLAVHDGGGFMYSFGWVFRKGCSGRSTCSCRRLYWSRLLFWLLGGCFFSFLGRYCLTLGLFLSLLGLLFLLHWLGDWLWRPLDLERLQVLD
jgi:hypothetical protein